MVPGSGVSDDFFEYVSQFPMLEKILLAEKIDAEQGFVLPGWLK